MTTLLLCMLLATPDDSVYITVDDQPRSKQVTRFIENTVFDCINPRVRKPEDRNNRYDKIRSEFVNRVVLVRWDDFEARKKHRVPHMSSYPAIRVGKRGRWEAFPENAFEEPIWPLYFVAHVAERDEFDYREIAYATYREDAETHFMFNYVNEMRDRYGGECGLIDFWGLWLGGFTEDGISEWWKREKEHAPDLPRPPVVAYKPVPQRKYPWPP